VGNPKEIAYGHAGGPGQGFTRFQIAGDPSPYFPLWAAGSMFTTNPAHFMEARGGAYRYGRLIVGGIRNLYTDGNVLRPIMAGATKIVNGPRQLLLGGLAGGMYDAILEGRNQFCYTAPNNNQILSAGIVVNGEICHADTTTAANGYGAMKEGFTFAASTLTATFNATNVLATLANAFAGAAVLTGPYAYNPNFPNPRNGDILEIVDGTSRFFRLYAIAGNAARIFPAYTGPGGAGLTYRIWRTGYGSWSRLVQLYNGNNRMGYYAGSTTTNQDLTGGGVGTLMAVDMATGAHYASPHLVDALGADTGVEARAVDVCYFKGYLLYGARGAISWTVPGFPTNFATGFGATDLPAASTSAINIDGNFLFFEQIGDQVLAFFESAIYLVQATGVVPEFTVYKVSDCVAPLLPGIRDPQRDSSIDSNTVAYTRPSAPGRGTLYYASEEGIEQLAGMSPKPISRPVETYNFPGNDGSFMLHYDRGLNALLWIDAKQNRGLMYQPDYDYWFEINLSDLGETRGLASVLATNSPGSPAVGGYPARRYRQSTLAYWRVTDHNIYALQPGQLDPDSTAVSEISWQIAFPIVSCGDVYDTFQFGGFKPLLRAAAAASDLNWEVFEGSNPYLMISRQQGTFDSDLGLGNSREILGAKSDADFIALRLFGFRFVELVGAAIYPVQNDSRR